MNSFSAGVLAYLRKKGITPSMVSVSSGAICSLFHYLDEDPHKLEEIYKHSNANYPDSIISKELQGLMHFYKAVNKGVCGKFKKIPLWERLTDFKASDLMDPFSFIKAVAPANILESSYTEEFFEQASERFRNSLIPIVTNAYNYETGKAVIFLNPAALRDLKETRFKISHVRDFDVEEITPDAIRGALQLLHYGSYKGMVDGAYQFNPFLPPLKIHKRIFLVTVIPLKKPLKPLETLFDIEDFKIKMMFLNSIYQDISNISLINDLVDAKIIKHKIIHKIDLKIIEPSIQKGFFDYFVEDAELFDNGFAKAKKMKFL